MTHPDLERYVRRRLGATTDADRDAERRKIVRFRPSRPQFSIQSAGGASLHDAPGGLNFLGGGVIVDGDVVTVASGLDTSGALPTATKLTAAGTTGTTVVELGNDRAGIFTITPGGAGIAAGSQMTFTFVTARPSFDYIVQFQPHSSSAAALTTQPRYVSRTANGFDVAVPVALASGTAFQWAYTVVGY